MDVWQYELSYPAADDERPRPRDLFDAVDEVGIGVIAADGQPLDGRVFRMPAAKRDTPEYDARDKRALRWCSKAGT